MPWSNASRRLAMSALALLLAACGGGGGGSGSSAPPPVPTLSFMPASYAENVHSGDLGTGTITAVVANPGAISGDLFVQVTGADDVFSTDWSLATVDATHYSITLHSLPSLSIGHHTGQMSIELCEDQACQKPFTPTPTGLAFDVDVEASPLHATATAAAVSSVHWGASDADAVAVQVTGNGLQWTATTSANWLTIDTSSGTGAGSLTVGFVTTTALDVGDYADAVTIAASDGQSVKIPFTLHVLPAAFALQGGVPSFNAINGATIAPQMVSFGVDTGASTAWTLSSDASWMSVTASGSATPGSATLHPDPSVGVLASGEYTANLQLAGGVDLAGSAFASNLTLVTPTLSTSASTITLGGALGRDLSAQSLTLALDTDSNAYSWQAGAMPAWLSANTSGRVNHAGAPLSLAPVVSAASAGSTSAVVTYTAMVNGDTVMAPVTVNLDLDQRRLLPSTWGVGLASSPTGTLLTRTITMRDNFGGNVAWTARSDKPWLSVTPAGDTSGATGLVLTADPSSLADGAIDVATVTVTASQAGIAAAAIRIGFYRSSTGLATRIQNANSSEHLVMDRIRPLAYTTFNQAIPTSVDVYNAYTGQRVTTIPNVGGFLGSMATSPDGKTLYVLDLNGPAIVVFDLDSLTVLARWPIATVPDGGGLIALRPNGVEVVILSDGTAYVAGRSLGQFIADAYTLERMSATDDGSRLYGSSFAVEPARVSAFSVDYSEVSGGTLLVSQIAQRGLDYYGYGDIAVTGDGRSVYTSTGSLGCTSLDPADLSTLGTFTDPGQGGGDSMTVATTRNGRLVCGFSGASVHDDFATFSSTGGPLNGYQLSNSTTGVGLEQIGVTPDGFVAIVRGVWVPLSFVPIGG